MIRLLPLFAAFLFLFGCAGSIYKTVPVDAKTGYFPTSVTLKSEDLIVSKKLQLERYKEQLIVMVVDGGRTVDTPPNYYKPGPHSGTERIGGTSPSAREHGFYYLAGYLTQKQEIDKFFRESFEEIGYFDWVWILRQGVFDQIVISGVDKKRAIEKELAQIHSRNISSKLGALKKRHKEGAISDEEYMRKQREIVNEYARARIEDARTGIAISDPVLVVSDLTVLHYVQEHVGDNLVVGIVIKWHYASYHFEMDLKILDPVTGDTVFHAHNEIWSGLDDDLFYPVFNAFIDWVEKNSDRL